MAEYVMPPEMEAFVEACGDVAMDNFDPAAFEADPSAAFADTMGAVMDFMGDSGMPSDMMGNFQDVAQGCFDQYMGGSPDAAPMDAFDAVAAGIDHHIADMPPDMPCADMAGEMPPPPGDFGPFMDECPPCGSFPGGESYDPEAHPHEGGMADMMGPPPGDMAGGPDMPPPGDMAGGPDMPPPGDMGPGPEGPPPGDMGPGPEGPPPGDMGPGGADPLFGPGEPPPPGGPDGPPPGADMDGDGMPPPPPGDMGGDGPGGNQPDDMGQMQSHMDDAGAHHQPGPEGPEGPPPGGDMDGDGMAPPPPPDDPTDDVV